MDETLTVSDAISRYLRQAEHLGRMEEIPRLILQQCMHVKQFPKRHYERAV
jgi:hypothetical protein